jgi:hypothetical protein
MSPVNLCRFCEHARELRESHILPKFATRWLKRTAVGRIRGSENPNVPIQDSVKKLFLCNDCEQAFEKWETPFAKLVFSPLHLPHDKVPALISYGDWALRFAVSVSWRVLKNHSEDPQFETFPLDARQRAHRALAVWRAFLRGERDHPAEFEQHLLPMSIIDTPAPDMSPFFNRYIARSVEEDLADFGSVMLVYSKLGHVILFGIIPRESERPRGWENTRLAVKRGTIDMKGTVAIPDGIIEFLSSKADSAAAMFSEMSDAQKAVVAQRFAANLKSNPDAPVFQAFVRDYELFGEAALAVTETVQKRDI